jgi:hypothetical protein
MGCSTIGAQNLTDYNYDPSDQSGYDYSKNRDYYGLPSLSNTSPAVVFHSDILPAAHQKACARSQQSNSATITSRHSLPL